MQNNPTSVSIKSRFKALFDIIQEEIDRNPSFRKSIEDVLYSEEVIVKMNSKRNKVNVIEINMSKVLHEQGASKLYDELETFPNDQLVKFAIKERAIKSAALGKKMERKELIDSIVKMAEQNSNRGKVFSKPD